MNSRYNLVFMTEKITRLVLATHNKGKISEFQRMLKRANLPFEIIGSEQISLPEPEETGQTFAENATLKAKHAAQFGNLPAIADDSGFCLDALNGHPGVYSKRFMQECGDYPTTFKKLHDDLGTKERTARFVCCLCLAFPDGGTDVVDGQAVGHFTYPPQGQQGFGYDPVFTPDGHDQTFASMSSDQKSALSHRGQALDNMITILKRYA